MNGPNRVHLHDVADQLSQLAGLFQVPGNDLKAQFIRRAEKNLVALESFFTPQLFLEAGQWKRSQESLSVLEQRLTKIEIKQSHIAQLDQVIQGLQAAMQQWRGLTDSERQRISQQAKVAYHFNENRTYIHEAHILHRYQRFDALRALVPYADNAEHLCEAIYHYENRLRYEESLQRLEQRKEQAFERLKSVKRGFYLALMLCVFIVTVPLCAPFAYSLWIRRREIEGQIANTEETIRREERRLQIADEGVVASQEIRDILGEVPLEQVRGALDEVRELRSEFARPEKSSSVTASLLAFLDLYRSRLLEIFGEMPKPPVEAFQWFVKKVFEVQNIESELAILNTQRDEQLAQMRKVTRGYSPGILKDSIAQLREVYNTALAIPFAPEAKICFALLCLEAPDLLAATRQALGLVSHGQRVSEEYWRALFLKLTSVSNSLSLCILDLDISRVWVESDSLARTTNVAVTL